MKYLKLYENFEKHDWLWLQIDEDEFREINHQNVDFDDKLYQKISDRLKGDWIISKSDKHRADAIFIELESSEQMLDLEIWYTEDDWFLISSSYYDPEEDYESEIFYKCDSDTGLLDWLENQNIINQVAINESLSDDQIEELSDLFVEVSDEFGLNEAIPDGTLHPPGQRPDDNGAWRLTRMSSVYTELFVQINVEQVDVMKFENSLEEFLRKAEKLGHRIERLWWRDLYKYDFMYRASRYMIKIW